MTLNIDGNRLEQQLWKIAEFRDASLPGWTRRPFTPEYHNARLWLQELMEAAGLTTDIDAGGNLFGQHHGPESALLVIGSHTDTVVGAGRFDGMLGVLAAIECARVLSVEGWSLKHSLRVYDFLAEEPSPYGVSTVGSRAVSGHLPMSLLGLRDRQGESLAEGLVRVGGNPDMLKEPLLTSQEVAAYLELHIEQGPYLETHGLPIGIVTGIVGIRRYHLTIVGTAGHAGTTPMNGRHDALVAASRVVDHVYRWAAPRVGDVVATVGQIEVQPNALNVIPGTTTLGLEARALDREQLNALESYLYEIAQEIGDATGCSLDIRETTHEEPALMHQHLQNLIAEVCHEHAWTYATIPSWAGHDAVQMTHVTPQCAMIFVPSHMGLSHCPEEWTEPKDFIRGANALLQAIIRFDRELD